MNGVAERACMVGRTIGRANVLLIQIIQLRRRSLIGVGRGIVNDL